MTYRITAYRSVLLSYARMDTSAAGFEPTQVALTDFKSVALTNSAKLTCLLGPFIISYDDFKKLLYGPDL